MRLRLARAYHSRKSCAAQVVYLPPYSPNLNPIELAFAKLRRLLQTAAERTIPDRWRRIGQCVDLFTPQECANYLRHARYRYT